MKRVLIACLILFLSVSLSRAQEKKNETKNFWNKIKTKIQTITPRREKEVSTVVGGVRGAKDDSANTLYWKGEETKAVTVGEDELEKFTAALESATAGNVDESKKLFEEFLALYPKSTLREDALAAINELGVNP
ncbi:MAG: hypothetical protein ACMUIP_00990 [bacterium]